MQGPSSPIGPGRKTVAVIGLGSIGGAIAGSLRATDRHEVVACVRTPIRRLILDGPDGTVELPLEALTEPGRAQPVDWVLLCTKAHQSAAAAPWLARLCGPATRVAVLQNGIGQAETLRPLVGATPVLPTIVYFNGERLAPDRVRFRHVAEYDLAVGDGQDGHAFVELFQGTAMRLLLSPDFHSLAWRKLLTNVVANPITALTLQRQGVLRRGDIQAAELAILEEAIAVGRADGARFGPDEAAAIVARLAANPAELGTSMYFDRLAGRPLEAEALTGAVVAAGERHGIPTPLNRLLLALLRAVSDSQPGSDRSR